MSLSKVEKIMLIVTGIFFFFTIFCGMWIEFSGNVIPESGVLFHIGLGIITTVLTAVLIFLLIKKK